VHPLFWPLQAFELNGQVYFDTRVQFGMRFAPEVATDRFTSAFVRDAERHGVKNCMAVMDDLLWSIKSLTVVIPDWKWLCVRMEPLGFQLSQGVGKTHSPAQIALAVLGLV
jgi:hypothetical protein